MKRDVGPDRDTMACGRRRALAGAALIALACASAAAPARADAGPPGIVIAREGASEHAVTANDLAALPAVQVTIPIEPGHGGPPQRTFEGPLLWTVLDQAGAIEPARVRDQVRQTVLVTGRDGYTAVLALGEIAPEFEGKQVIVAERADGQPLGPGNLRLVVPGDKRGGRGVHDIARIVVAAVPAQPR